MPRVYSMRKLYPDDAVRIDRATRWGNPFVIGRDGDRAQVLARYKEYLDEHSNLKALAVAELRGKDLVCWCSPLPCHGDILLKIANEEN